MKRLFAYLIVINILLLNILPVITYAFESANPFSAFDNKRECSISTGLGFDYNKDTPSAVKTVTAGKRYAIKFKNNISLSTIYDCVSCYDYMLLSHSEERMFAVKIDNLSNFKNKYSGIVEFIEEDEKLTLSATVNDPMSDTQWELESLNAYDAWDTAIGDREVIVAILDSGIYRGHEDFLGVEILAGYDTVTDTEGVNADYNGHGTKIASIIAATNDNGVGMASVGAGLTILPIRVSDSTGFVYSTDFIQALYFAADSGAHIINMSFGGYVYSAAEEAAAEYAASKGCILVASAGNEGTDIKYAGMKAYPASYANVISVGAVNSAGEHCAFSQYNDAVDLVAPGEELTVANAYGGYELENGTSFSTAYISAAIGLALSAIDEGVSFTAEQFVNLVARLNGNSRSDMYGYGFVNVAEVLKYINTPLYSGVSEGGVYHRNINIHFNRGKALLDNESFESGDMVLVSGNHTLTIQDGENIASIRFITDNIPLKYDYSENANSAFITFERGTATLDGVPYISATPITSSGRHTFVITGPYGNSKVHEFECNFKAPTVFGVENGGYYTSPVCVTVTETDTLLLNGTPFESGDVIAANGTYILTATKGGISNTVRFTIANPNVSLYNASVTSAKIAVDPNSGTVYLYNDIISGIRVLDDNDLNKTVSFIKTESGIINHAFIDERFVLIHKNGFSVISRNDSALGAATPLFYGFTNDALSAVLFNGHIVYLTQHNNTAFSLRKVNIDTGSDELIMELNEQYEYIAIQDATIALATKNGTVSIYNNDWTRIFRLSSNVQTEWIVLGDSVFCVGNTVYGREEKAPLFVLQKNEKPIKIFNDVLVTDKSIYSVSAGTRIGEFEVPINDICVQNWYVYKYLSNVKIEAVRTEGTLGTDNATFFLNAGDCSRFSAEEAQNHSVFSQTIKLNSNVKISDVCIDKNKSIIYAIDSGEKVLYCFDSVDFNLIKAYVLRFTPTSVYHNGKMLYISFAEAPVMGVLSDIEGECAYVNCSRPYILIKGDADTVFGLTENGDIFSFYVSSPQNAIAVIKNQTVVDFDLNSNSIFVLLKPGTVSLIYRISRDDFKISEAVSLNTDSDNIICTENNVFVDNKVYSCNDLTSQAELNDVVVYADSNYILTASTLHFSEDCDIIGNHCYDTTFPLFDVENNYFSFFGNTVLKVISQHKELETLPIVEGITDNAIMQGPVSPEFEYGVGYVDNAHINSGDLIENGGRHTFTLCLPFGVQKCYTFYIEAVINRINLSFSKNTIAVNESISASISAYPIPTVNVDTVFTASNDNAVVYEDGTVIGVSEGECTITATTVDGLHSSEYTINVIDANIVFDSSYFKEKEAGIVGGISPGTSIETMLAAVSATHGSVIATTKDNVHLNNGIITTEMKALLYNISGTLIDERYLSVTGDVDCDGFITANDYFVLEQLSAQPDDMTPAIKDAADVDGSGNIDAFDALTLKEHLLGENKFTDTDAAIKRDSRATAHLLMPEYITEGYTFTAGITLSNAQNISGIKGKVSFDPTAYTITEISLAGTLGDGDYTLSADGLHFFVKTNPILETQVVIVIAFNVVKGFNNSSNAFVSFEDIELYDGSAAKCNNVSFTPKFSNDPIFDIKIFNMPDFAFDENNLNYTIDLPQSASEVYLSAYPNESFVITGNTQFVGGTAEFSAITETASGEKKYNFVCTAVEVDIPVTDNAETTKNNNTFLSAIEVENGTLSPLFDKNISDYYVVCDVPSNVIIKASAEYSGSTVNVGEYDRDTQIITVTCVAESGANKQYRFHISRGAPFNVTKQEKSNFNKQIWLLIGIATAVLLAFVVTHQVKQLKNE